MFLNILHQWQEQPVAEIVMLHQWQEPTEHQFSNAMKQEYLTRTTRQQHTLERCAHTVVFGDLQDNAINHVLMRSNKKCYISRSQPRTRASCCCVANISNLKSVPRLNGNSVTQTAHGTGQAADLNESQIVSGVKSKQKTYPSASTLTSTCGVDTNCGARDTPWTDAPLAVYEWYPVL